MTWRITTTLDSPAPNVTYLNADGTLHTEERLGATNAIRGLLPDLPQADIDHALDHGGILSSTFQNPDGTSARRTVTVERLS